MNACTMKGSTHTCPNSSVSAARFAPSAPIRKTALRSEEHTSELQSLMRISYAVFCLKKKNRKELQTPTQYDHNSNQNNVFKCLPSISPYILHTTTQPLNIHTYRMHALP